MRRTLIAGGFAAALVMAALVSVTPTVSSSASSAPIVIGGQGDLAGFPGAAKAFEARIAPFNKAGGVDGRKIKFIGALDDNFSPATDLTNAQQLVLRDHVVVDAPVVSEVCSQALDGFMAQNKTPFVGYAVAGCFQSTKWGYGASGNLTGFGLQSDVGELQMLKAMGMKASQVKFALIGQDVAGGITSTAELGQVAKDIGIHVVYEQAPVPTSTVTNYAPYTQAIIASGANSVYEILGDAWAIGLAASLHAAGYHGFIFNGVTYYPGQLASNPSEEAALQGVTDESLFPTDLDAKNIPVVAQAVKNLKAVGAPPYLTNAANAGYWAADLLIQVLQATAKKYGVNHITGSNIYKVMNDGGFVYKSPIGNTPFPSGETVRTSCGTMVVAQGTGYKLQVPYVCEGKVFRNLPTTLPA